MHLTPAGGAHERRVRALRLVGGCTHGMTTMSGCHCGNLHAASGLCTHGVSNVGGVTAGPVRHNSSNVGGVTAGPVGHGPGGTQLYYL